MTTFFFAIQVIFIAALNSFEVCTSSLSAIYCSRCVSKGKAALACDFEWTFWRLLVFFSIVNAKCVLAPCSLHQQPRCGFGEAEFYGIFNFWVVKLSWTWLHDDFYLVLLIQLMSWWVKQSKSQKSSLQQLKQSKITKSIFHWQKYHTTFIKSVLI